jgi:hypothetical protein
MKAAASSHRRDLKGDSGLGRRQALPRDKQQHVTLVL